MTTKRLPLKYRRQAAILRKYANLDVDLRKAHSYQTKSRITKLWNQLSRMSGGTTGLVKEYRPRNAKAKRAAAQLSNQSPKTWKTFFLQGHPDAKIKYSAKSNSISIKGKSVSYALVPMPKPKGMTIGERIELLDEMVKERFPEEKTRRYKPALAKGDFGGIPFRDSLQKTLDDIEAWMNQYKAENVITGVMVMNITDLSPWDKYKQERRRTSRRRIKDNRTLWQNTALVKKLL